MVNWSDQRERGTPAALRIIIWIALHLGRRVARAVLYPITLYFLIRAAPQRRASRAFLTRVLGRPARMGDVARHIYTFAATVLDRVYLLAGRRHTLDVRVHRGELVRRRLAAGEGFLLMGSHLGSFEILRALAVQDIGMPLKILMDPEHNRTITDLLHALNPTAAESVISLAGSHPLIAVGESLEAGYIVGLLGDRCRPGEPTVSCDFLGGKAPFPLNPMRLAAVTGVPVILPFGLYRGGNRYDVYFEELTDGIRIDRVRDRGARNPSLEHWVQAYAERLEFYTRTAPLNWFNFYDFWERGESHGRAPAPAESVVPRV